MTASESRRDSFLIFFYTFLWKPILYFVRKVKLLNKTYVTELIFFRIVHDVRCALYLEAPTTSWPSSLAAQKKGLLIIAQIIQWTKHTSL